MAAKGHGHGPHLALFVSILAVMGVALWFYDRYSRERVLRLIHDLNSISSSYDVEGRLSGYA